MICDPIIKGVGDGNDFEIAKKMTLSDIFNTMEHPRNIVFGVVIDALAKPDIQYFGANCTNEDE